MIPRHLPGDERHAGREIQQAPSTDLKRVETKESSPIFPRGTFPRPLSDAHRRRSIILRLSQPTVLLILCWGSTRLSADDWPGLRGPTGTSISRETGLDDRWDSGEPPVLWVRELGQGYSSFAVVGDGAYTQYQTPFGQYLVRLDTRTGRTVWEYRYDAPYELLGIYPGPRSTPAVAQDRVYGISPNGLLFCLHTERGQRIWQRDLKRDFGGRGTDFGYSASPVLVEGMLLLPVGGAGASVVALDAVTGETRWTAGDGSASYASILPISVNGHRFAVAYLENGVSIHDVQTGRMAWQATFSQGYDEHSAAPLYEEPWLVLPAPFQAGAHAYRLEPAPDNPAPAGSQSLRAHHAWHNSRFSNDVVSSLLIDGRLYGFDLRDPQSKAHRPSRGEFRCLDLERGDIRWSTSKVGQASTLFADNKLLLFSDNGELLLAEANPVEYVERGRVKLFTDEVCWTSPALADGRLFLRSRTQAVCVNVGSIERLSAEDLRRAIPPEELPQRRSLYWYRLLNGEREHPFMRPDLEELAAWFAECLATLAAALAFTGLLFATLLRSGRRKFPFVPTLCGIWVVVAAAAAPLLNARGDAFHFTWPAALFAMFQWTAWTGAKASLPDASSSVRFRSRCVDVLFLILCGTYLLILQRSSLPHEWVFLMGFLPAWPMARTVALSPLSNRSPSLALAGIVAGFLLFFWSCGSFMLVRTAWGL